MKLYIKSLVFVLAVSSCGTAYSYPEFGDAVKDAIVVLREVHATQKERLQEDKRANKAQERLLAVKNCIAASHKSDITGILHPANENCRIIIEEFLASVGDYRKS